MPERLFDVILPAGDVPGFDIDIPFGTGQRKFWSGDWLSKGYDGVRFIGAGVQHTHVYAAGHNGISILVDRHPGIVQLENLTLHAGYAKGVHFGIANRSVRPPPRFKLRMVGCHGIVPPPAVGQGRTKWLLFGYNSDVELIDCELDATHASEHASYWHGFAKRGLLWERVKVIGSGAEGCKVRSDVAETAWVGKGVRVVVRNSEFKNWYQTWSDRGGAAIVMQGGAADIVVESCLFWGGGSLGSLPASSRSKCIMVSSEGDSYDILTGRVGVGFGNGFVVVKNSAMRGGPGQENYTTILRVGQNGGTQQAARGVLVENCGIWGQRMSLQFEKVPAGKIKVVGCNTPEIRSRSEALGMDTTHEAGIPTSSRVIPVSEGIAF
jgi:hypothetical protein